MDIMFRDSSSVSVSTAREQSWYEAQGIYGLSWLALFCGLYLMAVRAAWMQNHMALTIMSVTAFVLSVITGFSIGGAYLPSALGLFIGTVMSLTSGRPSSRC